MKLYLGLWKHVLVVTALALAACSGNFETGTGMPNTIPQVGDSGPPPYGANGMPMPGESFTPIPTSTPGVSVYAITDAQTGFQCPSSIDGYACLLRFDVPAPTPTPSPERGKKNVVPTPTPTPTPAPEEGIGDLGGPGNPPPPTPTPSPTPSGTTVSLRAEALPKDAPPMYHTPSNSLNVVPLMMVRLTSNGDFPLTDTAQAQFTLPKDQVEKRGFAVQLFQVQTHKKRTDYKPIWTFDKSTLKDSTLTFAFTPPKMKIAKGSAYLLVLYADNKPKAAPSPSASAAATPVPSPAAAATS
jgi:hypothetical protein